MKTAPEHAYYERIALRDGMDKPTAILPRVDTADLAELEAIQNWTTSLQHRALVLLEVQRERNERARAINVRYQGTLEALTPYNAKADSEQ